MIQNADSNGWHSVSGISVGPEGRAECEHLTPISEERAREIMSAGARLAS